MVAAEPQQAACIVGESGKQHPDRCHQHHRHAQLRILEVIHAIQGGQQAQHDLGSGHAGVVQIEVHARTDEQHVRCEQGEVHQCHMHHPDGLHEAGQGGTGKGQQQAELGQKSPQRALQSQGLGPADGLDGFFHVDAAPTPAEVELPSGIRRLILVIVRRPAGPRRPSHPFDYRQA